MEGDNPSPPGAAPTAAATIGASPKSKARLKTLLTNPWFGGIAALASIISIPLAFYLYISAQARPGLTIYVLPVRTPIVRAGQTSGLTVLFKGKETGPNITAVQIAIWNNGNTPIHKENILDDITLRLDPDYTILEASVRKVTRSVTGFEIVPSPSDPRHLLVRWKILEPGDGAIIQVIYDGPASIGDFVIRGTIEGQAKIVPIAPSSDNGAIDTSNSSPRTGVLKFLLFLVIGVPLMVTIEIGIVKLSKGGRLGRWVVGVVIGLGMSVAVGFLGYFILEAIITPYPPFGF